MKNEKVVTPFMKAERRLLDEFRLEAERLGLQANVNTVGGRYREDGVFVADFSTQPEPLKGNKEKVEALRAAGYSVVVYEPYGWGKRRGFVIRVSRPVLITGTDGCESFELDVEAQAEAEAEDAALREMFGDDYDAWTEQEAVGSHCPYGGCIGCRHLCQGSGFPGETVVYCDADKNGRVLDVSFDLSAVI